MSLPYETQFLTITTTPQAIFSFDDFLGAASPQAVKKLLALSEHPSGKARPKSSPPPIHRNNKINSNSSTTSVSGGVSATTGNHHNNGVSGHHGKSSLACVDLTAESSSVTSLPSARKGSNNGNHNSGKKCALFFCIVLCFVHFLTSF